MNRAYICITWLAHESVIPPWSFKGPKRACEIIDPIFPQAALMPYAVDLYRVGNTSPGTIKVVVFGPKFEKKLQRQNKATKPPVGMRENPKPIMENKIVRIRNPPIWRVR